MVARQKTASPKIDYPDPGSRSAELFSRAQAVLPDGGSRSTIRISPYSVYVREARGKYVTDVDGNRLMDFNNNYTALIHGHCHPAIVEAVTRQVDGRGTGFSFGSEAELALAELLVGRSENFDKIRFMNSGTEAVMNAIKAARAYTGKPKIAKCENAYHGSYDFAEVSLGVDPTDVSQADPVSKPYSKGTPQGVLDDVVVFPMNDPENALRILEANRSDLACVMIDPFGARLGRGPTTDAFLETIQDFCDRTGVLLFADEVVAFRAGWSGCQGERGLRPDLTALGKIIGGGFPVGAVAGRKDVMAVFETGDSKARLPHGGTYNANPVTMVAGHAAMEMMTRDAFERLNTLGESFRKGLQEVLDLTGTEGTVEGQYSVFALTLADAELSDEDAMGHVYASSGLHLYMVRHGYWLTPGMAGALSTVMDSGDVDPFCQNLSDGIRTLKGAVV